MRFVRSLLVTVIALGLVGGSLAAFSARADQPPKNFVAILAGENEVPARDTRARGVAFFQLSPDGTELHYQLIVANIENAFMAHIHLGLKGANGPIVVWLFPSTAPVAAPVGGGRLDGVVAVGTITAANFVGPLEGEPFPALIAAMSNGNAYVNVHTNDGVDGTNTGAGDFPGGEIRGQVRVAGKGAA